MKPLIYRSILSVALLCFSSFVIYSQSVITVSETFTGSHVWSADIVKVTGNISIDTLLLEPESGTGFWNGVIVGETLLKYCILQHTKNLKKYLGYTWVVLATLMARGKKINGMIRKH